MEKLSREVSRFLKGKNKSYETLDEAYIALFTRLVRYATSHLSRSDQSVDAVHGAFEKALEYINKKPGAKISEFILYRETMRACRRLNKETPFLSLDIIETPLDINEDQ